MFPMEGKWSKTTDNFMCQEWYNASQIGRHSNVLITNYYIEISLKYKEIIICQHIQISEHWTKFINTLLKNTITHFTIFVKEYLKQNVPAMACCPNSNDPKINWFFFPGLYRSNTKIKCSSAYISKFFRCPAFALFTTMCFSSIW